MNNVPTVLVITCLLMSLAPAQADERRRSGTDTARHPSIADDGGADHRAGAVRSRGAPFARGVPVDPAKEQFWSDKCVQQRARGWGHTGDCDSPAYTGAGRDLRPGTGWHSGGYRRYPGAPAGGGYPGRPFHPSGGAVIIVPSTRDQAPGVRGRPDRSGFSGNR